MVVKQKVVFVGVLNIYTGYGQHAMKIIEGLEKAGYDMYVRALEINQNINDQQLKIPADISRHFVNREQQEEWELLLVPPKHLPTKDKKTMYFTMWESTLLSSTAVSLLNRAEVVIVPCKWNAAGFAASGVTRPIRLVPLGIDTNLFRYAPPKNDGPLVFGCAGRIAHGDERKGLKDVIRAFSVAFPDRVTDVELWVKGFQDCAIPEASDKRIKLHQRYYTPTEYVDWLAGLNCFVSAAKSEGWGWHQQEAMAVGRPLIACKYGGLAEFFDETAGICLPYREVPAKEIWKGLGAWAQPNFDGLVQSMRWMYQNRSKTAMMGDHASFKAHRFSNENANDRLIEVMKEFGVVK